MAMALTPRASQLAVVIIRRVPELFAEYSSSLAVPQPGQYETIRARGRRILVHVVLIGLSRVSTARVIDVPDHTSANAIFREDS